MDESKRLGEYNSVGGSSTHILFNFPGHGALYMGSLLSISYSTFKDKTPVYNLGSTNIDGFAMGKRYVAGSIIKTMFMNDDLRQFLLKIKSDIGLSGDIDSLYALTRDSFKTYHNLLIDDIIPFDIIIVLCSEYGDWSVSEVIYGATFINTGQVYSISDIISETTMSFVANDVRMTHDKIGSQVTSLVTANSATRASQLAGTSEATLGSATYQQLGISTYEEALALVESGAYPRSILSGVVVSSGSSNLNPSNVPSVDSGNTSSTKISDSQTVYGPTDINVANLVTNNLHSTIDNIHDADTLKFNVVKRDGTSDDVSFRFAGIDAPETSGQDTLTQPYGAEAKAFLQSYLSSGKWDQDVLSGAVKILGKDRYGRSLVYNSNYAVAVVSEGLALGEYAYSSNAGLTNEELKTIKDAEERARTSKSGIWSGEKPLVTPSQWRKWSKEKQQEYIDKYGA